MKGIYLNALSIAMRYISPVKKRFEMANVRVNVRSVFVNEEPNIERAASNPDKIMVYLNPM